MLGGRKEYDKKAVAVDKDLVGNFTPDSTTSCAPQRDDPGHIDLSPPNWTGSQSSFLAQRDEDARVPLLVSPHPHTSVHDVGHGVRGVLMGLQRRSVGVDPYCMTSNHRWVDAQRRHCKGELMEAEPEAGGEHNGLLGLRGAPKEHLLTVGSGGGIPCTLA